MLMHPIETPERSFRRALGSFATGVTIVSGLLSGQAMGATVNSFSSVSLNPKLVLFGMRKQSVCLRCFDVGQPFAISVLNAGQAALANHFASPKSDKWADVPHHSGETRCPIVVGAIASFEGRVQAQYEAGDHVVVSGLVHRFEMDAKEEPLVFLRGGYGSVQLDARN